MNTSQKPQEHSQQGKLLTKEELLRRNKFLTEEEAEELVKQGIRELTEEDLRNEPDRDAMYP